MNNELLEDVTGFITEDVRALIEAAGGVLEFYEANGYYASCESLESVTEAVKAFQIDFHEIALKLCDEILDIEKRLSESGAVASIHD